VSLPVFRLVINRDDHTGVTAVALVDDPAIQINWQAFGTGKSAPNSFLFSSIIQSKFKTQDQEKRIISGPIMVADMMIYRKDDRGEYFVYFDRPIIEQIVEKFFRNKYTTNVNPMHDSMLLLPDVFMVESFLIDSARGINTPLGYDQLADGSWFGSFKVNNDEVWNDFVKTGLFRGFSVEGFFNEEPVEDLTDQEIAALVELLPG
jgi:hypothetical protein